MKKLNVDFKGSKYNLNIPTCREDIDNEYIKEVTNMLQIAPNYSLIGIISITEFINVVNPPKSNKDKPILGLPVFIRAGKCDDEFINSIKLGQTIIISDGDISLGHHINSPYNKLSMGYIANLCYSDKELMSKVWTMNEKCYFISFKLVPNNTIHAAIEEEKLNIVDPYVIKTDVDC